MHYVSGLIYKGDHFSEGYLGFENGVIVESGDGQRSDALATGIVLPTFVNAHTHVGDAAVKVEPGLSVEELVAPPNGLKHRMLRELPEEELVNGMRRALYTMARSGISQICDFREQGLIGVDMLRNALSGSAVNATILGRPVEHAFNADELSGLLAVCDGLGLSAVRDWDYGELERVAQAAKDAGKLLALHASEAEREDIDKMLALRPDFLVHMNKATTDDLASCASAGVPIVKCPHANRFFGIEPNIQMAIDAGADLMLGTDNAMINPPTMCKEVRYLVETGMSVTDAINSAVAIPRKVLNGSESIPLDIGGAADFVVFDAPEPSECGLMSALDENNISLCVIGGKAVTAGKDGGM